ncbi:MAG TPA: hypothetical protein VI278_18280 [Nitrososphaeraceae archaeon]
MKINNISLVETAKEAVACSYSTKYKTEVARYIQPWRRFELSVWSVWMMD